MLNYKKRQLVEIAAFNSDTLQVPARTTKPVA